MTRASHLPVYETRYGLVTRAAGGDERLVELRAAGQLATRSVDEHLVAARGIQSILLGFWSLVPSRHSSVSDPHWIPPACPETVSNGEPGGLLGSVVSVERVL